MKKPKKPKPKYLKLEFDANLFIETLNNYYNKNKTMIAVTQQPAPSTNPKPGGPSSTK